MGLSSIFPDLKTQIGSGQVKLGLKLISYVFVKKESHYKLVIIFVLI
jgi:hypothetical protein